MLTSRICLAVLAFFLSVSTTATLDDKKESRAKAERLVYQALEAEINGDAALRLELLNKAVQTDPTYDPARWQLGQVKLNGQWVEFDKIQTHALSDERLNEHAQMKNRLSGSLKGEVKLAQWCTKNGLEFYAKSHWLNVLRFESEHKRALRELNLRWYQGELLGRDEVAELKEAQREAKADFRRWEEKLVQWRSDILGDDSKRRIEGFRKLRSLSDPSSIEALEKIISHECPGLTNEVLVIIGRMSDLRATDSLVRHAVLCESPQVRLAACKLLKARRLHNYIPTLLGGMSTEIELKGEMGSPDLVPGYAGVLFRYEIAFEGWQQEVIELNEIYRGVNHSSKDPTHNLGSYQTNAKIAAYELQKQVKKSNESIRRLNGRIAEVLRYVSDETFDAEPQLWWDWWNDHNEYTEYEKERIFNQNRAASFMSVPCSCFRAGTPVWTRTGLRPIETIQVGDGVLSQDPKTGELSFRPVLQTTVRPPSPTVIVDVNGETIQSTLGHPMWVVGEGWKMAKYLEPSEQIHGLSGACPIRSLKPAGDKKAFNLVVGEFNTYFVGKSGLLVHDNLPRKRILAKIPGMPEKP